MQSASVYIRQFMQAVRHRWGCMHKRHEWVSVDREVVHDVGVNRSRCKHCQATRKWIG